MPKKTLFGLITLAIFFMMPNVYAKEYIVLNTPKAFKDSPSGSRITSIGDEGVLPTLSKVVVVEKTNKSGYGCRSPWYKVTYQDAPGYICSSDQAVIEESDVNLEADFEKEMLAKGFNESYLSALKNLHEKHPNWIFNALKTNLDYNEAIRNETIGEISLVNGSDESLRKKDDNGNFIESVKEKGWYQASSSAVGYYMDPRNFLTDEGIFMFENLQYNKAIQTTDTVKSIISNTFMDSDEYLNYFMKAAEKSGASPTYLVSRVRQEKGASGSTGIDGAKFTFAKDRECINRYRNSDNWTILNNCGTDTSYSGIYNFYNIGAYGSYQSPVIRGLIWANGGYDASVTSYMRPWNSKEKAIIGGALYIVNGYISANQHTLYLQKFNVSPNALNSTYTHQYMSNIKAPASEALTMYKGYKNNDLLDKTYEFLIPVYENMPGVSETPKTDDDKKEEIPEVSVLAINEAIVASGYHLTNNYLSGIEVNTSKTNLENKLKTIYTGLTVTSLKDKYGNNKNDALATGDVVTISNSKDTKEYKVVIYGDNNGDGNTSIIDLLRCQKYLLGNNNLSDAELIASDVDRDGLITVVDLLRIQKSLLGYSKIEQK